MLHQLLLLIALCGSAFGAELRYELVDTPVTPAEQAALETMFADVSRSLPERMKEALPRSIKVRLRDLSKTYPGSDVVGYVPSALEPRKTDRIVLDDRFIRSVSIASTQPYRGLGFATLLHETAHIYDLVAADRDEIGLAYTKACADLRLPDHFRARMCDEAAPYKRTVSTRRSFIALAGFASGAILKNSLHRRNLLDERSPDIYEFTSNTESFAVNFEHFILDPDYKCRKPLLYSYLVAHFGHVPFEHVPCTVNREIYLSDTTEGALPVDLDPARIYRIDYLVAGKGDAIFSSWGHAMFRLAICAPERAVAGPECLGDVAHHVVLSFRANISDLILNNIKGIFGGYPSLLFVLSLPEVIEEYNKGELRDLTAYPLALTGLEKERFLLAATEHFWGYQGDYKFIGNNCATEAYWLLRAAIRDPRFERAGSVTPFGLLDDLRLAGRIGNESPIVFASNRPQLERSFAFVKESAGLADRDFESYARRSTPAIRRYLFELALKHSPERRARVAANFYVLESHFQRVVARETQEQILAGIDRRGGFEKALEQAPVLRSFLELIKSKVTGAKRPWQIAAAGRYGIPLATEVQPGLLDPPSERDTIDLVSVQDTLERELGAFGLSLRIQHTKQIAENLEFFGRKVVEK